MFVSRLREEIPESIKSLVGALKESKVRELDMSDNAFGPDGISGWDFYVK
jgi:Ran GTPase-activating protein (RanGAP) involved in mRNA processing and transport